MVWDRMKERFRKRLERTRREHILKGRKFALIHSAVWYSNLHDVPSLNAKRSGKKVRENSKRLFVGWWDFAAQNILG